MCPWVLSIPRRLVERQAVIVAVIDDGFGWSAVSLLEVDVGIFAAEFDCV